MEYKKKMDWRGGPGVCRCCLSEGCFKDISSEYFWIGQKEVYAEMLKECFGLELSIYEGIRKGTSRLICEVCIIRLRDATNFKNQVLQSEKQFVEFIKQTGRVMEGAGVLKVDMESVKVEVDIKMESDMTPEGSDEEFLDETLFLEDDSSDDKPVSGLKLEAGEVKRSKTKSTKPKSSSEPAAKKLMTTRKVTASTSKPKKRGDKNIKTDRTFKKSDIEKEKELKMKVNAAIIIENTTVCPFKYFSNRFICLYCNEISLKSHEMRSHYLESHTTLPVKMIYDRLKTFEIVYVDITESKCRHCSVKFLDLTNLKAHLSDEHGLSVDENYPDGVVPFFLGNDEWLCAICKLSFSFFTRLCQHMNSHYENYICDYCGKGFLTWVRLRNHSHIHREGNFCCKSCDKTFTSKLAREMHTRKEHPIKERYMCFVCSLRFVTFPEKLKHNKDVHGMEPEYKCPFCASTFPNKWSRKSHVHAEHKPLERKFACDKCEWSFTRKTALKKHMVKHSGEKKYQCELCPKRYSRSSVLKMHMRVHTDDRRFQCEVCQKRFLQKHCLQSHLKTHHQLKS